MRKAQSADPVAVAKAMTGMEWDGLYGKARFGMKSIYGIDTTITRPLPMAIVKGGKPVHLDFVSWPANV